MKDFKNILINRTDAIGDVILTLPMAKVLKDNFPAAKVHFLGKNYTKDVIGCYQYVDNFINYSELETLTDNEIITYLQYLKIDLVIHVFPNSRFAKLCRKAKILYRVGTTNRIYHWWSCNKLINLSRKRSDLHEAQLNLQLLRNLVPKVDFTIKELNNFDGFRPNFDNQQNIKQYLDPNKKNIILHPRSHGSAREWGLENFKSLINMLHEDGNFNIIITGTENEAQSMQDFLKNCAAKIKNTTGKLSLSELITLISKADVLVAASTGPLHIASACGIYSLGLFIMKKPMHPGRWKPIGKNAHFIVFNENDTSLESINKIDPNVVYEKIKNFK